MTKKERLALIFNILALTAGLVGMIIRLGRDLPGFFTYYTQLSNIVSILSSAIYIIVYLKWHRNYEPIVLLRYLAACMMMFTFIVVVCIFVPFGGNVESLIIKPHGMCQHIIAPVFCVVSFAFFEQKPEKRRALLLPVTVTMVYAAVMYLLNYMGAVTGPYPFFEVHNYDPPRLIVWFIELVLIDTAIGAVLTLKIWKKRKSEE